MSKLTKSRSIIFSGQMIKEILSGNKTQTRRPINPQPVTDESGTWWPSRLHETALNFIDNTQDMATMLSVSPFGTPGDHLYVRETFSPDAEIIYPHNEITYRADHSDNEAEMIRDAVNKHSEYPFRWRPSIHMRRNQSRINLEVNKIRVEHLQQIMCYEIRKEGLGCPSHDFDGGSCTSECHYMRSAWESMWDSIYRKKFPYESDPWVWVIDFTGVDVNVPLDIRPHCYICGERWMPAEGVDASLVACNSCFPSIAGWEYSSEISPEEFIRRCRIQIGFEQDKIAPDNALISLLCNGVRLIREAFDDDQDRINL